MLWKDEIIEQLSEENEEAMVCDGFDDALVGICYRYGSGPVACYDYDDCIDILVEMGMSTEEALEYFDYNVLGAFVGEGTPVFVRIMRRD